MLFVPYVRLFIVLLLPRSTTVYIAQHTAHDDHFVQEINSMKDANTAIRGLSKNTEDWAHNFKIIHRKYTKLFRSIGSAIVE